jgi:hypothetical protein
MQNQTYSVKGNRTAADVVKGIDETIETGYDLESARIAAIEYQKTSEFVAAWAEEEEAPASPLNPAKLAAVVVAAKARTNEPRWRRAIDRAAAALIAGELIVTTLAHGALVTSPNGTYHVNGSCECKAAQNGHRECYHRAAARLVEMVEAAPAVKPARRGGTPRQSRIVHSVEQDFSHRYVQVVRCEGWMI